MRRTGLVLRCMVLAAAGGLLALGAGCGALVPDFEDIGPIDIGPIDIGIPEVGAVRVVVMWPEAAFAGAGARGMPAETDLVRVTVSGSGISSPLVDECAKGDVTDGQARLTFGGVPSGENRWVVADAIDTDAAFRPVLASRTATVTVPWLSTVEVHMDMALEPALSIWPTHVFFVSEYQSPSEWTPWSVSVRNAGDGTLNWTVSVDQPWISVSALSGTDDGMLGIGVKPDELPAWSPGDPPRDDVGWVTVDAGSLAARIKVAVHRGPADP